MAHYVAMRGVTDWLLTNPLLLVRMRTVSMGARENQAVYLRAIEHRATLLGLVSALAKPRQPSRLLAGSTQAVSHGETLDFVFESPGVAERDLRVERVPMGPGALRLSKSPTCTSTSIRPFGARRGCSAPWER